MNDRAAEDAVTPSAPRRGRHPHRRRRIVIGAILGFVVIAVAVFMVVLNRDTSRPVKVSEAIKKFHSSTSTTSGRADVLRPRPGVYEYTGSGTDHISTPPKTQDEGPQMPATVTLGSAGCWTFRIDYSTNHWQTWNYCSRDGELLEMGGQSFQRWDFVAFTVNTTSTFACDPPAVTIKPEMVAGETWTQTCTGTSTSITGTATTSGRYEFLGTEKIRVGDRTVNTTHFRQRRTMSGSQSGNQVSELWFGPDGLPIRNRRNISVDSSSPLGTITYTENANFSLTSLIPHT